MYIHINTEIIYIYIDYNPSITEYILNRALELAA